MTASRRWWLTPSRRVDPTTIASSRGESTLPDTRMTIDPSEVVERDDLALLTPTKRLHNTAQVRAAGVRRLCEDSPASKFGSHRESGAVELHSRAGPR